MQKLLQRSWLCRKRPVSQHVLFLKTGHGLFLQDAYVKDWVDNTMLFVEVENVEQYWDEVLALDLTTKYEGVRLVPIRHEAWGKEFFLHDPSGILWHFGEFFKPKP
jgi:formate-dependent nitrite reductase cytochrome c552 subunit